MKVQEVAVQVPPVGCAFVAPEQGRWTSTSHTSEAEYCGTGPFGVLLAGYCAL
jgi:hypothetical protein